PAASLGYVDTNVVPGVVYEYAVFKNFETFLGEGFVWTGIEVPVTEARGKIILLIETTDATSLAPELRRLQEDLVGDGWTVLRHDVSRTDSVLNIKAIIDAEYHSDPTGVKALFLFGHVPVPYSGDLMPDGHPDHEGAWPADLFYGVMDAVWTDDSVNATTASDPRNRNIPGDGKFDQNEAQGSVKLQIGRVDFANLPAFAQEERELLRQYLYKDHYYRHAQLNVQPRGLINDNLGILGREAFAVNGWRNFAPLVGSANIDIGPWPTQPTTAAYLWGCGCGAGTYTSAAGVASTAQFVTNDTPVVFSMFFGSYFGDWDSENNFMRAQLATPTYTLAAAWAGRPGWYFHHMGLGETIGFSTRASQDAEYSNVESPGLGQIHVALMGDPTLRLYPVPPPSAVRVETNGLGEVRVSWRESASNVLGYHVYHASTAVGPFTAINEELVKGTDFPSSGSATDVYMVRAVKWEVTPSGSYYNASQGIFQDLSGSFGPPQLPISSVASGQLTLSWPADA